MVTSVTVTSCEEKCNRSPWQIYFVMRKLDMSPWKVMPLYRLNMFYSMKASCLKKHGIVYHTYWNIQMNKCRASMPLMALINFHKTYIQYYTFVNIYWLIISAYFMSLSFINCSGHSFEINNNYCRDKYRNISWDT